MTTPENLITLVDALPKSTLIDSTLTVPHTNPAETLPALYERVRGVLAVNDVAEKDIRYVTSNPHNLLVITL